MTFEIVKHELFMSMNGKKVLLRFKVYRSDKNLMLVFIFRQYALESCLLSCRQLVESLLTGYIVDVPINVYEQVKGKKKILTIITPKFINEKLLHKYISFLSINLFKEYL